MLLAEFVQELRWFDGISPSVVAEDLVLLCQSTSGAMLAVEAVLQIDRRLADQIV